MKRVFSCVVALIVLLSAAGLVRGTAYAGNGTASSVAIDEAHFPDSVFREYVQGFDEDKNGVLSSDEISRVNYIYPEKMSISSLAGIEYFTELQGLYCRDNDLTSLDISKNTKLDNLDCTGNSIAELDISKCPYLVEVYFTGYPYEEEGIAGSWNMATSITVDDTTTIKTADGTQIYQDGSVAVSCHNFPAIAFKEYVAENFDKDSNGILSTSELNDIKSITVKCSGLRGIEHFPELKYLDCSSAWMNSIDTSANTKLEYLDCSATYIKELNVSGNTKLKTLYCFGGMTKKVDISGCAGLSSAYRNGSQKEEDGHITYSLDGYTLSVDSDAEIKAAEATGKWIKDSRGWWYKRADGTYPKNQWEEINGKWYHFDASGYMQTGWQKIGNVWYFFNAGGDMVTGWKKISGKWYYFSTSGAMATGWKTISGKTYFFKSSGAMAANEWCQGWWLNANGTWTYKYKASWKTNSTGWWYEDTSGWYARNCTITIDSKAYTFDSRGYWVQ